MTAAQGTAIVTGAGSGIGRAVARSLLEAGYRARARGPARGTAARIARRIINNGSISALVPRPRAVGYTATKMMDVRNAAEAVLYMASLPLDANVQFLTVTATRMPFIGRG